MAGRKTAYDQTYLTPRSLYREAITSADLSPADADIPDIYLDLDLSKQSPTPFDCTRFETAGRAYNGYLELYIYFTPSPTGPCVPSYQGLMSGVMDPADLRCHATIRVWAYGGPQDGSSIAGQWCLVHEQTILTNTCLPLRMLPASRYRVTVDDISTNCRVDILEQHTQ